MKLLEVYVKEGEGRWRYEERKVCGGGGVKSGTWKEEGTERKREHLVLIDTDRDCNECGGGTAP